MVLNWPDQVGMGLIPILPASVYMGLTFFYTLVHDGGLIIMVKKVFIF
jgi:hypothetical protein